MMPVSKRRLATTTLGIALAISILFSSLTLGNNMAKYDLYRKISNKYHLVVEASILSSKVSTVMNEIENVPEISSYTDNTVIPRWWLYAKNMNMSLTVGNVTWYRYKTIGTMFHKGFLRWDGSYPQKENEIMMNCFWSNEGIAIGDFVNLVIKSDSSGKIFYNKNLKVVGFFWLDFPEDYLYTPSYPDIYMLPKAFQTLCTSLGDPPVEVNFYVKVDENYIMSATDPNDVEKKLRDVLYNIYDILERYNASGIYGEILVDVKNYNYNVFLVIVPIIFSTPVVVIGVYLSKVGIEISLYERKREFGVLKVRGANNLHIFKLIFIECIIYSLIGGISGYLLGEYMGWFANILFFKLPYFFFDLSIDYVIYSVVISFLLFFIALYSPWKKISKESMVSLISHYSQRFSKIDYKRGKDIVLAIIFWGYLILGIYLLKNYDLLGGYSIITLVIFIILMTFIFMFPVILVVLPLVTSRLFTLGTQKVYGIISKLVSRLFRVSGELSRRSLEREPKRAAYLAFILAFILTLSTFLSVTMDNEDKMIELRTVQIVGGDFLIYTDGATYNLKDMVENNTLTSYYSYVKEFSSSCGYSFGNEIFMHDVNVIMTNFDRYNNAVYDWEIFLKEGFPKKGTVGVTWDFAKNFRIKIGDYIFLDVDGNYKKYKITFIVYAFPGFQSEIGMYNDVNFDNATHVVTKAKNYQQFKEQLDSHSVYYLDFRGIYKSQNQLSTVYSYINTIQMYLIVVGAASIFVVQYSLFMNRKGEIALYKVRGARNTQVLLLLFVEGITVIILAVLIGFLTGTALSCFLVSAQTEIFNLPDLFVLGNYFLISMGIIVGIYFLCQYILAMIFARVDIDSVIRGLGGEM